MSGWVVFIALCFSAVAPAVAWVHFSARVPSMMASEAKSSLADASAGSGDGLTTQAAGRLVGRLEDRIHSEITRLAVFSGLAGAMGLALACFLFLQWRRAAQRITEAALRLARGDFDGLGRLGDLGIVSPPAEALSALVRHLKKTVVTREYVDQVVDGFPGAILATDCDGRVIVWNEAARQITGHSASDILGRDCGAIGFACDAQGLVCPRNSGFPVLQWEMPLKRRDGREIVVSRSCELLPQPDGGPPGTIEVFFDVTEKRKYQDLLLEQTAELRASRATAVQALDDLRKTLSELGAAKEAAEEASRLKGQFLANVSHEIRTPLNAIMGFAALLQEGPLFPDDAEYAEIIARSSEHLKELIDQILDLEKIQAGEFELLAKAFGPRAVLQSVGMLFRPKAEAKGLRFEGRMDTAVPEQLFGDSTRVRQILINLISNAVTFTESGSVEAELFWATPGLGIRVFDTGPGVPKADLDRIFDPFYQVDGSTSRRYGGAGLGLSIVRGLAAAMGGDARAENRETGGAVFTVLLPAVKAEAAGRQEHPGCPRQQIEASGRGRVLLVENDPPSALLVKAALHRAGYTVEWAEGGLEGLRKFDEGGWDAVLLDMQMPELDGYEFAGLLRGRADGREVPLVAVTAQAMAGDRERCLAAGCTEYVPKPLDREELLRLMARVVATGEPKDSPSSEACDEVARLQAEYLGRTEGELKAIRAEVEQGDFRSAARRAHSLRGSGGTYGYAEISARASDLERACGSTDRGSAIEALRRLGEHLKDLSGAEAEASGAMNG